MVISIKYMKISFQNVCIFISGSSGAASHEELSIKKKKPLYPSIDKIFSPLFIASSHNFHFTGPSTYLKGEI